MVIKISYFSKDLNTVIENYSLVNIWTVSLNFWNTLAFFLLKTEIRNRSITRSQLLSRSTSPEKTRVLRRNEYISEQRAGILIRLPESFSVE